MIPLEIKKLLTVLMIISLSIGNLLAQQTMQDDNSENEQIQYEKEPQAARLKNAEPISKGDLPDAVINSFEESYFKDWNITEIYRTENMESIPADYIIKVEKGDVFMYLFFSSSGELIVQETQDISTMQIE